MKKIYAMVAAALLLFSLTSPVLAQSGEESALSIAQQEKDWAELAKRRPQTRASHGSSGTYEKRAGIILVTKNNDSMSNMKFVGHAAIMFNDLKIVHVAGKGVIYDRNDWNKTKSTCYAVGLYDTSVAQDKSAADWAGRKAEQNKIKKIPYNYNFFNPDREDAFYCSQLVYMAYKKQCNVNLNTKKYLSAIPPIELVNEDLGAILFQRW